MSNTTHTHHPSPSRHRRRRGGTAAAATATTTVLAAAVAVAVTATAGATDRPASGAGAPWTAAAVLHDTAGTEVGTVTFAGDSAATTVTVELHDLTDGAGAFHGLHVHGNDDGGTCDPAADPVFSDVGGHWNPAGATHGHHAGDLPVVYVGADGSGSAQATIGPFESGDLEGRAVILHAGPDNLANIPDRYETVGTAPTPGPDEATLATGDAGPRQACGIINGV